MGLGGVWFALLVAAPAPAAEESPLAQIPGKAPIVISLHGFERTKNRLLAMIKEAVADLGPVVQAGADKVLNDALAGRQLKGLKPDGPIFLIFPSLPGVDGLEPKMALIVRVTDYKTFRDGFLKEEERKTVKLDKQAGYEVATFEKETIYLIQRKDYAVVAHHKDVARELAKRDQGKGLDTTLDKDLAKKLLAADLAAYVDMAQVNKLYGLFIALGQAGFDKWIKEAPDNGSLDLSKEKIEIIKTMVGGVFQAVKDSRSLLVTVDFHPQGVAFKTQVGFAKDSKANQFLKTMKPSALAGLDTLPAGLASYTAVEFGPDGYKAFHPLTLLGSSSGKENDKGQNKEFQEALNELLAAKPQWMISSSRLQLGKGGLQIWQYGDPAKGMAAQLKYYKSLKEGATFQFAPLKGDTVIKMNAQSYRDAKLHSVRMKWDLEKFSQNLPGIGDTAEAIKKLTGDGITLWFGNVDKLSQNGDRTPKIKSPVPVLVQVWAKDWQAARKYLDQYFEKQKTIAGTKGFVRARSHLPREATLVSLTDVSQFAELALSQSRCTE
jgi:hypothetical protein